MDWIALPDAAVRQSIDSATVFAEFQRVQGEARSVAGGMYFKRQGPYEYLVRTSPDNRQQRIGPRTAELLGPAGLRELSPISLKGIEQPIRPWEVLWEGPD